ncbi:hypothetical protein DM860_001621 [Cuscuta australis]|uniref:Uncharacterized protein n=1 Tax=Cuscuta australis TaxID=267555 RepID=A0A328ED35_9ASTE|nr:hypothetical protein DM860_001621 [Cuscuta australis]
MGTWKLLGDTLFKSCIISSSSSSSASICRGFVSSTRPSQKAKVDKETCQRVVEAAGAVKEGAKEVKGVVSEVKEAVATGAGSAVKAVAEKAIEKAAEGEKEEEEKGTWEKVKDTSKAIKKEVLGDNDDS